MALQRAQGLRRNKMAEENKQDKIVAEETEKLKKRKKESVKVKKEEAVAKANDLRISKKHAMYICSFIKGKEIDKAISELEEVKKLRKVVPFKGEIPHRKGKGIMSGRYPVKAAGLFINVLKSLKGNSLVNGLELEKTRISFASASWGRRPLRRDGMRGKRTNVVLKSMEVKI